MVLSIKYDAPALYACRAHLLHEIPLFSPFYSQGFENFIQQALGGTPGWLSAWDGDRPLGFLLFFKKTCHGLGTIYNSTPWFSSPGGCVIAKDAHSETRHSLIQAFYDIAYADKTCLSTALVLTPHETEHLDVYTQQLPQAKVSTRFNQTLTIPRGQDSRQFLLENHRKRCILKKSYRFGFAYAEDDAESAWDFIYKTHKENMLSVGGKIKPWEHFSAFAQCLPKHERVLSLALHEGVPIAGIFCLKHGSYLEYTVPVVQNQYRSTQALSFLISETIAQNFPQGGCVWNFGGCLARNDGVYSFKKHWGTCESIYSIVSCAVHGNIHEMMLSDQRADIIKAYPYWFVYQY